MKQRALTASGGGGFSETELWTRAVSSMSGGTTATLSQSMTSFDALRIFFYQSTSNTSTEYIEDIDVPTLLISGTEYIIGQGDYSRYVYKGTTNTDVVFRAGIRHYHINTDNTQVIPFKICGIKY